MSITHLKRRHRSNFGSAKPQCFALSECTGRYLCSLGFISEWNSFVYFVIREANYQNVERSQSYIRRGRIASSLPQSFLHSLDCRNALIFELSNTKSA